MGNGWEVEKLMDEWVEDGRGIFEMHNIEWIECTKMYKSNARICALQMYLSSSLGLPSFSFRIILLWPRILYYFLFYFFFYPPIAPFQVPVSFHNQAFKLMKRKIPEHSESKVFFLFSFSPSIFLLTA